MIGTALSFVTIYVGDFHHKRITILFSKKKKKKKRITIYTIKINRSHLNGIIGANKVPQLNSTIWLH